MTMSPRDELKLLKSISFKVRIEPNAKNIWQWGSGFFVSADGTALTAYHNLPRQVLRDGHGTLTIFYQGQELAVDCLLAFSRPDLEDIAVIRLKEPLPDLRYHQIGYCDPSLSWDERIDFWSGRRISIFGYPCTERGQADRLLTGLLDAAQPIWEEDIKSDGGTGPDITGSVEWLQMVARPAHYLACISGAPILDQASGCLVGVQHRILEGTNYVLGTEIGRLFRGGAPELEELRTSAKVLQPNTMTRTGGSVRQAAPPPENPFYTGGRINDPRHFFGRTRILREVRQDLHKFSNVSVVGEREIGKSSLLYHLHETRAEWLPDAAFVYVDLQSIFDDVHFSYAVLEKLGETIQETTEWREALWQLQRALRGRQVILLLDEVEKLARPELSARLPDLLRALSQEPTLALCVATQRPLEQVFANLPDDLSPFYNVFTHRELGPLTEDEARECLARAGGLFTEADVADLLAHSRCHPAKLQRLARRLFDERQRPPGA